eukprot:5230907-Pyramimonas_sp.AAC.1
MATTAITCRQGEKGSVIDCALVAANLVTEVRQPALDEAELTSKRRPVPHHLQAADVPMRCRAPDEPAPIGAIPPVGRARPPRDLAESEAPHRRYHDSDGPPGRM